ncbi:ribosome assembly factor SBDS [Candidatus Pacearchaeota archaeon]|jgi:ribosome maturation protein SDO1|nr:ribosome assembly factor SBDS [Candidatus Pacearchaeota archaeon]|tara:strand:- start:391 stop:1062 length:672 start_codon:yes stop_codon:yes gene_type:complete
MTNTLTRIKKAGKNFEIIVDLDEALRFKKGEANFVEAEGDKIFTDSKKGFVAPEKDLREAFGMTDVSEIVKTIIKEGEVQLTQEHRDEEQEKRFKQIVEFLSRNAIDPQTGNPITAERIKNALEQANVNIKNVTVENQIKDILDEVSKIIPIKLETKRVKIIVPAIHTGKAYGIVAQYKENEKWLDNGDLKVGVSVPSGMIIDFYDRLNNVTHGAAITEEIKG